MTTRLIVLLLVLSVNYAQAQLRLPRLLTDGVVLQREEPCRLWGWAKPSQEVRLTFRGETHKTLADDNGKWSIMLPPQKAGGPFAIGIQSGTDKAEISDVYFGEVWVCSGQSNMELPMSRLIDRFPEALEKPDGRIRQFLVPDKYDLNKPHHDLDGGQWVQATQATVTDFGAVGYFFALEISQRYDVRVGLINSALGGSPIESWMDEETIRRYPEALAEWERFKNLSYTDSVITSDRERSKKWHERLNAKDIGLAGEWMAPELDESGWGTADVPGYWSEVGVGAENGSVWLRKNVLVPDSLADRPVVLHLGRLVDHDYTYFNGELVGEITYKYPPRRYPLPVGVLKPGNNALAIRLVSYIGSGGAYPDKPYCLAWESDTIPLSGDWKYKRGATLPPLQNQTFVRWKPTGLYNRMLHPLFPFTVKGMLWYQGESNAGAPEGYAQKMECLIDLCRQGWQKPELPFLYVQLAAFMPADSLPPKDSGWARLREEQAKALRLPGTGMASAIDVGEWNDIHPLDKKTVGQRLALLARNIAYGENVQARSPRAVRAQFKKGKVVIKAEQVGKGLVAAGDKVSGFVLGDENGSFHRAEAKLKGDEIIVWLPGMRSPTAVRYAWANNPASANVYSEAGLPLIPFEFTLEDEGDR